MTLLAKKYTKSLLFSFFQKSRNVLLQFLFWAIYFGLEYLIEIHYNIFSKTSIIRYFSGIMLFYFLEKILKKESQFTKFCLIIMGFGGYLLMMLCLKYETINLLQKFSSPPISVQALYIIDSFARIFFLAWIYSIYLKLNKKFEQEYSIENQLFEIQTSYLNSKIDTHFFLNSINIFYAYFLKNETDTANKILRISAFFKKNL